MEGVAQSYQDALNTIWAYANIFAGGERVGVFPSIVVRRGPGDSSRSRSPNTVNL
jgi:hypothetical protein